MSYPTTIQALGSSDPVHWSQAEPIKYEPKPFMDNDVMIKIHACGVCGTDVHTLQCVWGPHRDASVVVGHEIVGEAIRIGSNVTHITVGQIVGLGPVSNSCGECELCLSDREQYCVRAVFTYDDVDFETGSVTKGGFASHVTANQRFVIPIPKHLPEEYAGPLMCAGLTVFSPLYKKLNGKKGQTVGIVGIGGLGHLGLKFAKALGAHVVAISRTLAKKHEALTQLGADDFVATEDDPEWANKYSHKLDMVLYCGASMDNLDLNAYLRAIRPGGQWVTVGVPNGSTMVPLHASGIVSNDVAIKGSKSGSGTEAVKMLKMAADHQIYPIIEKLPMSVKNYTEAMERLGKYDVKYRFVLTGIDQYFQ
ncbi:Alcohol dehydrogenase [Yamadazyma tenuis]|uniref:GroES-like protein n=1 Tax=Candida tenuis (strain ATCC 10573 / BCRC 21748 / CBS 615 / JCM 9827 / NBRC 10315 / NRRL Y-1498 / VKM Y-70) TaxID=590646 RepID=G3BF17_CANTC|nr:GroES-like protein [Yamadazyma tenuis ATCC 10573]EGV59988.1 GroES-like protein [Yamadazyma tenuis ATCC 10573]WEJ94785.1 Alcohol dehydrogenase [Yamadazyma tenuis]